MRAAVIRRNLRAPLPRRELGRQILPQKSVSGLAANIEFSQLASKLVITKVEHVSRHALIETRPLQRGI